MFLGLLLAACVGDIEDMGGPGSGPGAGNPKSGGKNGVPRTLGAPQIRLLSGAEYRATVLDLLGVSASATVNHADFGSGYDSGSNSKLDGNLWSILMVEAERLAKAYVKGPIKTQFPCFDSAKITNTCIEHVIEDLGKRTYRRPPQRQ